MAGGPPPTWRLLAGVTVCCAAVLLLARGRPGQSVVSHSSISLGDAGSGEASIPQSHLDLLAEEGGALAEQGERAAQGDGQGGLGEAPRDALATATREAEGVRRGGPAGAAPGTLGGRGRGRGESALAAAVSTAAGVTSADLKRLDRGRKKAAQPDGPAGLFPTLIALGTSKGGSTFLYDCVALALHPSQVCSSRTAADWVSSQCAGRRFVLPAVRVRFATAPRTNRTRLHVNGIKENYVLTTAMYHGPPDASRRVAYYRGPKLPLELWAGGTLRMVEQTRRERESQDYVTSMAETLLDSCARLVGPESGGCPVMNTHGQAHRWRTVDQRIGEACGFIPPGSKRAPRTVPETALGSRCAKAGGVVSTLSRSGYFLSDVRAFPPYDGGDAGGPSGGGAAGRCGPGTACADGMGLDNRIVGIDACPYYFAETNAPQLLVQMAPRPELIRLVVLVRNPVLRAYSEWGMAQSWKGIFHRSHSFERAVAEQVQAVQRCMGSIGLEGFVDGSSSHGDFFSSHKRCVRNDYYHYVTNSLYGVHLRNWLAWFSPKQFLVLETEAMKAMPALDLVRLVGSHAGVAVDAALVTDEVRARCEARSVKANRGSLPGHKTKDEPLDPLVAKRLERFFFHGHAPVLNMVLPPQLRPSRPDAPELTDPVAARAFACSLIFCGPQAQRAASRPGDSSGNGNATEPAGAFKALLPGTADDPLATA
mmetsp:Transcript_25036/g.78014  ORF Transcript_25036/g.78014 Transcript_25036/m.78014 type:complete len:708 (-) Transcript_25036:43-2166(-)